MNKNTAQNELFYRIIRAMLSNFIQSGTISVEEAEAIRLNEILQLNPIIGSLEDEVYYGQTNSKDR